MFLLNARDRHRHRHIAGLSPLAPMVHGGLDSCIQIPKGTRCRLNAEDPRAVASGKESRFRTSSSPSDRRPRHRDS
jgi:hypothetical protein